LSIQSNFISLSTESKSTLHNLSAVTIYSYNQQSTAISSNPCNAVVSWYICIECHVPNWNWQAS